MSALPNAEETALLELLMNAGTWPNIAQNASSSPYSAWYLGLATASPGETGNQSTNQAAYSGYARESTARASGAGGWDVAGDAATLSDALTSFPQAAGGSETENYFTIGGDPSGTGRLVLYGGVTPPLVVATGTTPQLTDATAVQAA